MHTPSGRTAPGNMLTQKPIRILSAPGFLGVLWCISASVLHTTACVHSPLASRLHSEQVATAAGAMCGMYSRQTRQQQFVFFFPEPARSTIVVSSLAKEHTRFTFFSVTRLEGRVSEGETRHAAHPLRHRLAVWQVECNV